jgi:hypothetical protein
MLRGAGEALSQERHVSMGAAHNRPASCQSSTSRLWGPPTAAGGSSVGEGHMPQTAATGAR